MKWSTFLDEYDFQITNDSLLVPFLYTRCRYQCVFTVFSLHIWVLCGVPIVLSILFIYYVTGKVDQVWKFSFAYTYLSEMYCFQFYYSHIEIDKGCENIYYFWIITTVSIILRQSKASDILNENTRLWIIGGMLSFYGIWVPLIGTFDNKIRTHTIIHAYHWNGIIFYSIWSIWWHNHHLGPL